MKRYSDLTQEEKKMFGYPDIPDHPIAKTGFEAFLKWTEQLKIEYVKSEAPVYSREHNYAGTLDAIAIINGRKSLLDFKTSNYIYFDQYMMQVAAYELAYTEESGDKIEDRYIIKIPKTDK